MNGAIGRFSALDAQVVGISVDSVYSHMAWQERLVGNLDFPLCADFWPHGDVAAKFGVLRKTEPLPGINERAIFVVDRSGTISFAKLYDLGDNPDLEEVLASLEQTRLQQRAG